MLQGVRANLSKTHKVESKLRWFCLDLRTQQRDAASSRGSKPGSEMLKAAGAGQVLVQARKTGGGEARLVVSGVLTMAQPTGDIYSGNTKAV